MISAIYASFCALLIAWLALKVITQRRKSKINVGDGGNEELQYLIGAHANAAQYIPIALILLFALEYNGAGKLLIHILGIALVAGRILHARGMLTKDFGPRVLGTQITIYTLFGLVAANLVFVPYQAMFTPW